MPWSRLRANRPTDGANRRHSVIDTTTQTRFQPEETSNNLSNGLRQDPQQTAKSPSPLRKSFEPSAAEDVTSSSPRPPSPDMPPPRRQRFSMLKYRHASDPQISKTAREQSDMIAPPMPAGEHGMSSASKASDQSFLAPSIITTAPTDNFGDPQKRKSTFTLPKRQKATEFPQTLSAKQSQKSLSDRTSEGGQKSGGLISATQSARESRITFDEPERARGLNAPPPYGDESSSSLALPVSRLSESSRSDGSLGDNGLYAQTTTTHTVSTTTTFFRLPRRKKNKGSLFPLPAKTPPFNSTPIPTLTPRASTSGRPSESPHRQSPTRVTPATAIRRQFPGTVDEHGLPSSLPSPTRVLEAARRDSTTSAPTGRTSPVRESAMPPNSRGRSSTKGSLKQMIEDERALTPPLPQSGRTSTSTTGRTSLGGVFNLSRLRQNSEPQQSRASTTHPPLPGTPISAKSHSFSLAREPIVVPERLEGETPAKYLIRLEENVSRHIVATILSQKNDEFFKNVLRSYMRGFKFFGEPLDMAVRKVLMEVELPKETQQIDRVLQSFANRYHECNPGVYASPDEAYFIAFSILILHTDVFNKNNKNKMQKQDYTRNARGQGVAEEILECFYDNISYTPFIHVDDDIDISGERRAARKLKKNPFVRPSTDSAGRPSREPVDPYTIILDDRLDSLRPPIKEVMNLEDHFNYLGTAHSYNLLDLSKSFFRSGVLQILSSRSRPEAFTSPETMANPAEAHPGVVDMKVTKVGILWRKDMKKKKARSPWQEWGAVLTGASLYFFRNSSWVKTLMHQHDSHHKHSGTGLPCVFKPPLEQFKPDVLLPTQDAVALVDTTYKKHKNALLFVRHGGIEETFLADTEADMNDWLAKLNFAAAFRTAGVNMRDLAAENTKAAVSPATQQSASTITTQSTSPAASQVMLQSENKNNNDLAQRVKIARRQILAQRIADADEKLSEASRQLEAQLRNARHLQILAPIQNRTREQIVLAAGGMAAKIKWMRMDIWRTRCHRDILAKDLEEDLRLGDGQLKDEHIKATTLPAPSPSVHVSKPTETQEEPTTPSNRLRRPSAPHRPVTQPSPEKTFNMDDVFSSMQQTSPLNKAESAHQRMGSWELPPLSFVPTKTSMKSGSSTASTQPARHPLIPPPSSRSVSDNARLPDAGDLAVTLATPVTSIDNNEQEVLRDAGIAEPESPTTAKGKRPETPNRDGSQSRDMEYSESRSKVRRSLHRTLRESAHVVPSHHRSKKGKDSAGSATATEENSSQADSEGLARGTGSFTVHGKKASVITFGSEWQGMSPEERLNLRKQTQSDGSKLSVPSAMDDEGVSVRSVSNPRGRPISAISASTATTKSTPFEETFEEAAELPTEESDTIETPQPTPAP